MIVDVTNNIYDIFNINAFTYNMVSYFTKYTINNKDTFMTIVKLTIDEFNIFKIFDTPTDMSYNYTVTNPSYLLENDFAVYRNYKYLFYLNRTNLVDNNLSFEDMTYPENLHDLNNIELLITANNNSNVVINIDEINTLDINLEEITPVMDINVSKTLASTYDTNYNTDTYLNSDKTLQAPLEFGKSLYVDNTLSNIDESSSFWPSFDHYQIAGCEYSNANLTKQFDCSHFPHVDRNNDIHESKQKDNQNTFVLKNLKINLPFNAINTTISALFGMIDVTIPEKH